MSIWKFFKFGTQKETVDETENQVGIEKPQKMKPVPKWTRAGREGKEIWCPVCGGSTIVHHFSWHSLVCPHCRETVDKYSWLVVDEN